MSDVSPPVPRRWKTEGSPSVGKSRRSLLLIVLVGLVAVAGSITGLLYWLSPPTEPAVLPLAITMAPTGGPTSWLEEDRMALAEGGWLGRPLDDWGANPSRDQIRLRFRSLASAPRSHPVVVYLASAAAVDATGGVFLLPADRLGDHPRNRLALAELLTAFRDCPAQHRLLILGLVPAAEDPLLAAPPGDLSAATAKALEDVPDPGRLCLLASSSGQVPLASPELGRTVFGWYLEAGLRGEADGWASESPDGRVTVNELAAFVRFRVGRWTTATRGVAQSPRLVGSAPDFTLRALTRGEATSEKAITETTYPDWLRAGWERHDRWHADGRASAAPWAFRRVRAALLAAERDLLGGKPAPTVQRDLDQQLTAADQLATALTAVPIPDPLPTLAALYPGYVLPDPTILTELREAVRRLDSRPPVTLAPGEKPTPEPAVPPEFDAFKARPHPLVALAAFLLLADDPDPTPARLRGLAQLLDSQTPTPRFAETTLIRRLAGLAAQAPVVPWSSERAAMALQTARLFEETVRPTVRTWALPALDRVYRLRADAEAVLFAPGFAPGAEASRRLQEAVASARRLKEAADRLRTAARIRDEATNWLTGSTEMVNAGTMVLPVAERLAEATRKLGDALLPPPAPLDLDAFTERGTEWDRHVAAVRAALEEFTRPLEAQALVKARARAEAPDAGSGVVAELDVVLATPLLATSERVRLWNARAALAARLATEALRKDATDHEAIRKGLAGPTPVNPREPIAEASSDLDALRRRARWAGALLRVGGIEESTVAMVEADLNRFVGDRFAFADRLRRTWVEEMPSRLTGTPTSRTARLARVLPIVPATTILDSPLTNPDAVAHRSAAQATWAWQAARFEYERRELVGDDVAVSFAASAARACRAGSVPGSETYLEVTPTAIPTLTPERQTTSLRMNFRVIGETARTSIRADVLSPSDAWVKVGKPSDVALDPLREGSTAFPLAAGGNPTLFPDARGVLVEAELGGRTYHRRVPVVLDEITDRLTLFVRAAPGQPPIVAHEIRVRPNGTIQPYQLLLANPTSKDRKVIVRLAGLNRETDVVTIPAGKSATLAFPAPPAIPVPPVPPGQPPPIDEGLVLKGDELVLQLFDPTDRDVVRQTIRMPVTLAQPTDYLRVTNPLFQPSAGPKPNRLSVTIVPGDVPPGGPCSVRLGFPPDRNPGLVVRDGSLTGPVVRGGPPLSLYADNLALPGPAGADVCVTIAADGVERVITYFASLPSLGETIRLSPVSIPMVRVKVEPVATGTAPLPVTLEVDNAPPGATLELLIGTAGDDRAPVVPDLTLPIPTPKDVATRVKFDPKGETLLLSGSIKDHEPKLPIELLVGKRVLEARLLDRTGKELASHRAKVTFDGTAPRNVRFLDLPPKVRKDQPLAVRATCDPTVSGIKDVKFFIGRPQNNTLPQAPPPVVGKLFDEKTNEWRGVIPVEGQKGVVTIGVQFTTNVGLSKIETQDVELVDPAELNKPEPGAVAGKLIENSLPQAGAVVFLYDDKGTARAKTTTKPDGTFEFKELLPGKYYLFSEKETTNRQVKEEIAVKAGETTSTTLELLLK